MRFKQQFEFHKVPEWDEHYLHYESYLEKIGHIIRKMRKYKKMRISSICYNLSESFEVIHQDGDESKEEDQPQALADDDSLKFSFIDSDESSDLEAPLLSLSTDVKELLDEFVHECKEISSFYERETSRITNNFGKFYAKFLGKVNDEKYKLNLEEDLKEHSLDGLGYASSWARQFAEFYSKLSWLDGFAKINVTAIQKILKKCEKLVFNNGTSGLYK